MALSIYLYISEEYCKRARDRPVLVASQSRFECRGILQVPSNGKNPGPGPPVERRQSGRQSSDHQSIIISFSPIPRFDFLRLP